MSNEPTTCKDEEDHLEFSRALYGTVLLHTIDDNLTEVRIRKCACGKGWILTGETDSDALAEIVREGNPDAVDERTPDGHARA